MVMVLVLILFSANALLGFNRNRVCSRWDWGKRERASYRNILDLPLYAAVTRNLAEESTLPTEARQTTERSREEAVTPFTCESSCFDVFAERPKCF